MHLRSWIKAIVVVQSLGFTLGFQSPARHDIRPARTLSPGAPYPICRQTLAPTSTVLYDSWRQYVPLVVSVAVIGDILLGSPAANSILALARPPPDTADDGTGPSSSAASAATSSSNSKERVDTQKMANEAIEKAQNALELRRFLDDTKSDWDKIQDKQREVERQQALFDNQESK